MVFKIKEARAEYNITQEELSDLTTIPKRTIENWESGTRKPSKWVEKLVDSYLRKFPKNDRGIITERIGTYDINQIKDLLLTITSKYDISKIILFGSYAKAKADPLSDIDLAVDGDVRGLNFYGLLEEISNIFVKDVDVLLIPEVDHDSKLMKDILEGIVLYERS